MPASGPPSVNVLIAEAAVPVRGPAMWRTVGAKVTGAAHAAERTPCQDAFAWTSLSPDLAAIAVADAAGSPSAAHVAAELAVTRAVTFLGNVGDLVRADQTLWMPAVRGAFDAARGTLHDFARQQQLDSRLIATTLQVLLLGRTAYCYGRLGDGGGVG